jgi:hypothetical protein
VHLFTLLPTKSVDAFVREGTTKSFNPWPGANKDSVRNRSTAALTIPLRPKLPNVVLLVLVLLVLVLLVLVLVCCWCAAATGAA